MPSRRTPTEAPPSADARAMHVLLERLQSDMTVVVEAVTGWRAELKAEIAGSEARLTARITILEEVVRQNSADIRDLRHEVAGLRRDVDALKESVAGLRTDVAGLRTDVDGIRHDLDHRAELDRIGSLEDRVTALEARVAERH